MVNIPLFFGNDHFNINHGAADQAPLRLRKTDQPGKPCDR